MATSAVLPHALTTVRIGLAIWLLLLGPDMRAWTMLACITGAGITDGLDGYLARRWQVSSRFGSILDLIADGLFFLACVITFWRIGVWPGHLVLAILSAALPEVVAQAFFLSQGRPGSPRRWWNRALGGYSYVSVAAVAAGLWPLFWGVLQAALAWTANVLDLMLAFGMTRRGRALQPND